MSESDQIFWGGEPSGGLNLWDADSLASFDAVSDCMHGTSFMRDCGFKEFQAKRAQELSGIAGDRIMSAGFFDENMKLSPVILQIDHAFKTLEIISTDESNLSHIFDIYVDTESQVALAIVESTCDQQYGYATADFCLTQSRGEGVMRCFFKVISEAKHSNLYASFCEESRVNSSNHMDYDLTYVFTGLLTMGVVEVCRASGEASVMAVFDRGASQTTGVAQTMAAKSFVSQVDPVLVCDQTKKSTIVRPPVPGLIATDQSREIYTLLHKTLQWIHIFKTLDSSRPSS